MKPEFADAYNNIGTALKELGFEEALEAFNKSLSIKPASAYVYRNLGNTQKKLDRLYEAEESYKKAIALKPDDALS